nr:YheC/YheD family protein [Salipaludibacillus neizhouensis]
MGFDFGEDRNGKVWVIEVNGTPKVEGFRFLNDLRMYQTIKKYEA